MPTRADGKPSRKRGEFKALPEDVRAAERRKSSRESHFRRREAGRDVGPIPRCIAPKRRERCGKSLKLFLETYFAPDFKLAWSEAHLELIATIETTIREGGKHAIAMPRGSGKTTIVLGAVLWALLYGFKKFVGLVGANSKKAKALLKAVKYALENNELLAADFPEVCVPIVKLQNRPQACASQHCQGRATNMEWTSDSVILPDIEGSVAAGSIIQCAGLMEATRGLLRRTDHGLIRPDIVICDDPQTDKSAASEVQCQEREDLLNAGLSELSGPGVAISVVMPCTVIRHGDMAHRVLDRDRNPEWQGRICKALVSWPTRMDLWDHYRDLRQDGMRRGDGGKAANEFLKANLEEMHLGAKAGWEARKGPKHLSAVHECMDKWIDKPKVFLAEHQQEPEPPPSELNRTYTAESLAERMNRHPRGMVPAGATTLVAFIDPGLKVHHWMVAAFRPDFTGSVVAYGHWPRQQYLNELPGGKVRVEIGDDERYAGKPQEDAAIAALNDCVNFLAGESFEIAGSAAKMQVERLHIDYGLGILAKKILAMVDQSPHQRILTPAKGVGIGAAGRPIREWIAPPAPGRIGNEWMLRYTAGEKTTQCRSALLTVDANHWKSFMAARLAGAPTDTGAMTFYGDERHEHESLILHLMAEYPHPTEEKLGSRRSVDVWTDAGVNLPNHWLDCLYGCCVAADVTGKCKLGSKPDAPRPKPKPWLDQMREYREGRPAPAVAAAAIGRFVAEGDAAKAADAIIVELPDEVSPPGESRPAATPPRLTWKQQQEMFRRGRGRGPA